MRVVGGKLVHHTGWRDVLVALVVFGGAGCGGTNDRSVPVPSAATRAAKSPTTPPNFMRAERVAKQTPGSARRALLSWWRAVQFRDVDSAVALTDPTAIRAVGGATAFRAAVRDVGDGLPGLVVSESVKVSETLLALRSYIEFYDKDGKASSRMPLSFSMSRSPRGWRMRDATYLKTQAAAVRKARADAAR